jgi:bifunctional non-homologous end joining protein LigD
VASPPGGEAWLHELKHDGYRMGIVLEGGSARIKSRRGLDWSSSLGELGAAAEKLPAHGRASFQLMQNAFRGRRSGASGALVYFAFDLLHFDGEELARLPLEQRKERLRALLARAPAD